MTRRIWIIVTAVTLSIASIGGITAFAGGGADDEQGTSPSLGMPVPGYDGIEDTEVVDGSGLDVEILPKYDGPADGPPPSTEGPIEEPVGSVGGDPLTMGVPAPGFAGLVDEMIVVSDPSADLKDDADTR